MEQHLFAISTRSSPKNARFNQRDHQVGDIVQIHNENKRFSWKLAVVENLIRSADGKVRAAEVRTANGKTNRPINKLYPLELSEPEDSTGATGTPALDTEKSIQRVADKRPSRRAAAKQADRRISSIA